MIYYLIGINGSGMHALADILNDLKYKVLGADNNTLSNKYEIDLLDNIKYNHEYFYIIGNSFKESDIHKYLRQNKYKYDYYRQTI